MLPQLSALDLVRARCKGAKEPYKCRHMLRPLSRWRSEDKTEVVERIMETDLRGSLEWYRLDREPAGVDASERLGKLVWGTVDPTVVVKFLVAGEAFLREHFALVELDTRDLTPDYLGWLPCFELPTGETGDLRAVYQRRFPHTLQTWARARGRGARLDGDRSRRLFAVIREIHELGLCHRDIHAGNVVVDGSDVRLIDFGSSERIDEGTRAYQEGIDWGSLGRTATRKLLTLPRGFGREAATEPKLVGVQKKTAASRAEPKAAAEPKPEVARPRG